MSNIIPPLLSNSPPPPPSPEEDEDDEFGDFTGAHDLSYGCDNLSLPPSPDHSPKIVSISNGLDINSNTEKNKEAQVDSGIEKDYQDRRKLSDSFSDQISPLEDSCIDDIQKEESFPDLSRKENFHIEIKSEINSEIYNKALVNDKNIINEFSEKENQVEDIFYETNQKVNHVESVLAKSLENETQDFVINGDCLTLEENVEREEFPVEEKYSGGCNKKPDINGKCGMQHFDAQVEEEDNVEDCSSYTDVSSVNNLEVDEKEELHNAISLVEENKTTNDSNKSYIEEQHLSITNYVYPSLDDASVTNKVERDLLKSSQNNETVLISEIISDNQQIKSASESVLSDLVGIVNVTDVAPASNKQDCESFNEFGDFSIATTSDIKQNDDLKTKLNVNEDDFGDFSSHLVISDKDSEKSAKVNEEECEDDFREFTSATVPATQSAWNDTPTWPQDGDEFGNFADFSEVAEEPVVLTLNEKQAFEKAEIILKEIFPCTDEVQDDYQHIAVEKDDFLFNELKDVTETPALLYQWSKSTSQNVLLKALNIDARNILYGPSWNPSMPRFAANLGLKPLEPVKTEIPSPVASKSSPSISVQSPNVEIPSAQFDWNGSGLVNPLDSVSKEHLEPSSPSDIIQKPLDLSIEPSLILQPKPVTPQDNFKKVPSKTDLEQKVGDDHFDDFDDFTSYQPTQESQSTNWPNVPLRETYISSDNIIANTSKDIPLDIEGWLQPTIVTPELPRKELSLEEELPDIQTPELCRKSIPLENLEDDFDDFQVSSEMNVANSDNCVYSGILEPMKTENKLSTIPTSTGISKLESADFSHFYSSEPKRKIEVPTREEPNKTSLELDVVEEKAKEPIEEDEFTDFHSFAPVTQPATPKTLTPILEPLKPVPVYPTVQYPATSTSTLINWPDPGITDEEIKKFEMVFSQPQIIKSEKNETWQVKEERKPPLENPGDDDEWSDFVSVQKPSPVHKFQSNEKERTSSPDLPLSVLNLGNIQPNKQPIPVITPQGLVQTKLSSHSAINMSPKAQLKPVPQPKSGFHPRIQPSIISNQFATQAYNFNKHTSLSKVSLNAPVQRTSANVINQKSLDDDDWSDFVSSPLPPPATANGYQHVWPNVSSHQRTGWTNAPLNIITNPGHFVQSGSDVRSRKVPNYSVTSKKNTVPSISIPDLEFIAPKERTSSSRKK